MGVVCEERRGTSSKTLLLLNSQRTTSGAVEGYEIDAGALAFLVAWLQSHISVDIGWRYEEINRHGELPGLSTV